MTSYANAPKTLKAGIILLEPDSARVQQIIPLQYNPESLYRCFQVHGVDSGDGGDRSQWLFAGQATKPGDIKDHLSSH